MDLFRVFLYNSVYKIFFRIFCTHFCWNKLKNGPLECFFPWSFPTSRISPFVELTLSTVCNLLLLKPRFSAMEQHEIYDLYLHYFTSITVVLLSGPRLCALFLITVDVLCSRKNSRLFHALLEMKRMGRECE